MFYVLKKDNKYLAPTHSDFKTTNEITSARTFDNLKEVRSAQKFCCEDFTHIKITKEQYINNIKEIEKRLYEEYKKIKQPKG